jgi:hypothetical protein
MFRFLSKSSLTIHVQFCCHPRSQFMIIFTISVTFFTCEPVFEAVKWLDLLLSVMPLFPSSNHLIIKSRPSSHCASSYYEIRHSMGISCHPNWLCYIDVFIYNEGSL